MADAQPNPVRLALEGSVTVRNIDGLHANLVAALMQPGGVVVACAALEETDLSLVQLLLSARRTAQQSGRSFALAGAGEGALHAALMQGGFLGNGDADPFWGRTEAAATAA
ncbi:MAG: STAS domain-containing protein [Acetobacteraceae bacterium]|nr:STAS domain-containing protein [Acetobacteraceae bacterium]